MIANEIISNELITDQLFQWAGRIALVGWIILIFFPRRIKLLHIIPQYVIPFGLAIIYSGLMMAYFFTVDGGFNSLDSVRTLFQSDHLLLAGWIHYLAFDLFIGAWIATKADKFGLSRLLQAPILVATFMFGPLGLLVFLSIKIFFVKQKESA